MASDEDEFFDPHVGAALMLMDAAWRYAKAVDSNERPSNPHYQAKVTSLLEAARVYADYARECKPK